MIDVPLDPEPFDPGAIRAVAFDAYGTLFYWDFREVLQQALNDQGLVVDDIKAAARSFESAWNRVSPWAVRDDGKLDRDEMFSGTPPDFITTWEIWRRQFTGLFEDSGLDGDPTLGANLFREVLSHAPAFDDAHNVVEALHVAGYRLGLLSNADEDFLQSAVSHNRLRFSVIQSSESLRIYKPNRAAFLELCHRLGCAPDEVLYVGDSAQADVAGARHAGLRVAWLSERAGHELPDGYPRPDFTVASLTAAAEALGVTVPAPAGSPRVPSSSS